ncbi:MAG: hypothetical protein WC829_02205 [Hyphomicrobium sp.]|jgi:hypothetical protein
MTARQLPAADYHGLKTAFRALVRRIGSATHAAELTRVRQQEISNYGSAADEYAERFAPIDVIADLEAEVGPLVTAELARLTNHMLLPLPAVARCGTPLGRITGQAMRQVGEAFADLGKSLDDGVITKVEGAHVAREIDEAIVLLARMKLQVIEDAKAEQGGRGRP